MSLSAAVEEDDDGDEINCVSARDRGDGVEFDDGEIDEADDGEPLTEAAWSGEVAPENIAGAVVGRLCVRVTTDGDAALRDHKLKKTSSKWTYFFPFALAGFFGQVCSCVFT